MNISKSQHTSNLLHAQNKINIHRKWILKRHRRRCLKDCFAYQPPRKQPLLTSTNSIFQCQHKRRIRSHICEINAKGKWEWHLQNFFGHCIWQINFCSTWKHKTWCQVCQVFCLFIFHIGSTLYRLLPLKNK